MVANRTTIIKFVTTVVVLTNLLLVWQPVFAGAPNLKNAFGDTSYLNDARQAAGYEKGANPDTMIGQIIRVALSFLGVIFLILMIYGGYLWMTARGAEEQVTKAKNIIKAAVIGLIIVLAAYAISYFVISRIGGATLVEP